jgi:hypothetical protein
MNFPHSIIKKNPVLRIQIRDAGSGIGYLFDPGIRDPGWEKGSIRIRDLGSGIRDEQPGSYFLELRNHFFAFLGVKILNSVLHFYFKFKKNTLL